MKSKLLVLIVALTMVAVIHVNATPITIVQQGDAWQYAPVPTDLWGSWGSAGYSSFNWGSASWSSGNAAFGNAGSWTTYWAANTDIALKQDVNILGNLSNVILNVASDNGFMVFVNGQQIAKANAEGWTSYWEYSFNVNSTPFNVGANTISVLAEDHGGLTFFDMKLTGDLTPVPEPASLALMGFSVFALGLVGFFRKRK